MNVFSRLRNSSCLSPSCNYQMNGMDLGGTQTIHYESILDILISRFSGIIEMFAGS